MKRGVAVAAVIAALALLLAGCSGEAWVALSMPPNAIILTGTPIPSGTMAAQPVSAAQPPSDATSAPAGSDPRSGEMPLTGESDYLLYLEKGSHTLTIFGKDDDGYYTRVERTILCGLGRTPALTPTGLHTLTTRERWHQFGEERAYAQYVVRFASGRYLHSALYEEEDENKMYRNTYEEIGENVTGGCLRMAAGEAYWIYENCPSGTQMYIVNGSPLGTRADPPPKVGDSHRHRDPTDPKYQE